jgi:cell division topological specificity factor MinE
MSFLSKLGQMMSSKTASIAAAPASKSIAKERLSVILASQRGSELLDGVDMDALQNDVLDVVKRHIAGVAQHSPVNCQVKNDGDVNLFEMSVEIDSCTSRNNIMNNGDGNEMKKNRGMNSMIRPARVSLQV